MKKIFLSVIGMYLSILSAFSQNSTPDSVYKKRKLSFEEANLVSSYYKQDGDFAAVTGGTGSEKLTDISNTIDLKFIRYDKKDRKHSITGEIGIDHYTSASSDKIDPSTISSASSADTRFYPSIDWTMENEKKGNAFGAGLSFSAEYDYSSIGTNLNYSKKTKNKNGEFTAKLQLYLDKLSLIYPIELRPNGERSSGSASRNTYSVSLAYSQIINTNLQVAVEADVVYQNGYLGLPFHRVYFKNNGVGIEALPSSRLKIPIGLRANYFIGDKFIIRSWYRNYHDDWGINSNALQLETVVKLNPFFSVTPFYRFYQQAAADYFAAYKEHAITDKFFTSNYDLSDFTSNFFGGGFRIAPPHGVFKIKHINALEIRYGHYAKSTGMSSDIISMHLKFK